MHPTDFPPVARSPLTVGLRVPRDRRRRRHDRLQTGVLNCPQPLEIRARSVREAVKTIASLSLRAGTTCLINDRRHYKLKLPSGPERIERATCPPPDSKPFPPVIKKNIARNPVIANLIPNFPASSTAIIALTGKRPGSAPHVSFPPLPSVRGDGNCTRHAVFGTHCPQCGYALSAGDAQEMSREDATLRELVAIGHRLKPEGQEKIVGMARGTS